MKRLTILASLVALVLGLAIPNLAAASDDSTRGQTFTARMGGDGHHKNKGDGNRKHKKKKHRRKHHHRGTRRGQGK